MKFYIIWKKRKLIWLFVIEIGNSNSNFIGNLNNKLIILKFRLVDVFGVFSALCWGTCFFVYSF